MANFRGRDAALGELESGVSNGRVFLDPEMFRCFLESLSPNQMSMLILSGALDIKLGEEDVDVGKPDPDRSFPLATEAQGFDVEEWEKRPEPKIR